VILKVVGTKGLGEPIRKSFIGKETLQFMLVLANVGVILSCPGRVVVKFIHIFFFVDRWKIGQLLSY
jgi:hypothetical protein